MIKIDTEQAAKEYCAMWADDAAMERLEVFSRLVIEENSRQNLISKPSEGAIWQRHIADSAQLLEHVPRETLSAPRAEPWLDLGTGAGFPGVIIAILNPNLPVKLVESRQRRIEFLKASVESLDLSKCHVIGEKLERIEPFASRVISARAFAPLDKLLRLSSPFSTKTTRYILPKGRSAAQELECNKKSIREMFHVEQSLTDQESGIMVSF